jgi:tetraacyldisaccharide 4'-kinase
MDERHATRRASPGGGSFASWWGPAAFGELVSGRRRGASAAVLRGVLRLAEIPYGAAVQLRNAAYSTGLARTHRVAVPVISIGNLTLGGTGKTPLVRWLAQWFLARGVRVALISRGYKARPGTGNDEALELAQQLPGVLHLQDPNRVRAAARAIAEHACQLLLLDDAFQHRRIARDLDVVLLDALQPFGFDHVFPRGTLREPPAGLGRAHIVALSRADAIDDDARRRIREQVRALAPNAAWLEMIHQPRGLRSAIGQSSGLDTLAGRRVAAFCGIGNPAGFRQTLHSSGCELVALREFPDHHPFAEPDLVDLGVWAKSLGVAAILCTQKDLVKIDQTNLAGVPLWAVTIGLEIQRGGEELATRLNAVLSRLPDRNG